MINYTTKNYFKAKFTRGSNEYHINYENYVFINIKSILNYLP